MTAAADGDLDEPGGAEHDAHDLRGGRTLAQYSGGDAEVPRLGREELGADLVAIPAHDPVPTRNIVAVHRRSMSESPAVRTVVAALAGATSA